MYYNSLNKMKSFLRRAAFLAAICLLAAGCGRQDTPDGNEAEQGIEGEESIDSAESIESSSLEDVSGKADDQADEEAAAAVSAAEDGAQEPAAAALEDGVYLVRFDTDGSMFHVNEACEGKGTLTVKDGEMMLHISLPSKNVVNLFPGLAGDAQKEGAVLLEPTLDTITYSDGMTEEVHGFDIPVAVIGEEFDLALLGTKGKWYDHKVRISDPEKTEASDSAAQNSENDLESRETEADGEFTVDVSLEGGTGKATITSPATVIVKDGNYFVRIEWSSSKYDYMKLAGESYYPVNIDGNSVFELPISISDKELSVIADTTAMGTPHEIEYTITFDFDSMKQK